MSERVITSSLITMTDQMSSRQQETHEGEPEYPPRTRAKRSVSFGSVRTRHFERILSDNVPSSGPPIGIGWAHHSTEEIIELDDHEQQRRKDSSPAVPLTSAERATILKSWAFTRGEIDESQHQVLRVQSQRHQSNASLIRYRRFKRRAVELSSSIQAGVKRLNPLCKSSVAPAATTFEVDVEKYKSTS